ncbi:MAG: Hsp20 family protein [Halobacteriovoraceae bacterium]|jgi:HSP20 family molecular chaperone IbpA|nr:Hsp20 family protein [Halobacteriovoraceae bacterium]MBT5095787.1 Hsp20 family protein [Halobacteriovoraceae bacterium]
MTSLVTADRYFWNSLLNDVISGRGTEQTYNDSYFKQDEKHYFYAFEVPGLSSDDLSVEIKDNLITLSGQSTHWNNRNFQKSFYLPQDADLSQIEASVESGILALVVGKIEESKPQKINIQSGKTGLLDKFLNLGKKSEN